MDFLMDDEMVISRSLEPSQDPRSDHRRSHKLTDIVTLAKLTLNGFYPMASQTAKHALGC